MVHLELRTARPQQALPDHLCYHRWQAPGEPPSTLFFRVDDGILIRFPGIADFLVSPDGGMARAWPEISASALACEQLFRNQVRPLALSLTGALVIHASAVEHRGGAIAFAGRSGAGKSTLAVSLARSGCRLIDDDGIVLMRGEEGFFVSPGDATFRLWEDSEAALAVSGATVTPAGGFTEKKRFVGDGVVALSVVNCALVCVFVLGQQHVDSVRISPLSKREAMMRLLEHSFLLEPHDRVLRTGQMAELAAVVAATDILQLDYPRDYKFLEVVAEAILKRRETAEH